MYYYFDNETDKTFPAYSALTMQNHCANIACTKKIRHVGEREFTCPKYTIFHVCCDKSTEDTVYRLHSKTLGTATL